MKTGKINRGCDFTSVKVQSRLAIVNNYFSQRTINECNKLSPDCVNSSSINMFKEHN